MVTIFKSANVLFQFRQSDGNVGASLSTVHLCLMKVQFDRNVDLIVAVRIHTLL